MKGILFVLPSLCPGGAERVFATLLNHFPHDRYQLHLALVYKSVDRFYEIPAHVAVHELSVSRVILAAVPLLRLVWRIEPVAIFSALAYLNMLVIALKWLYPHHPGVFAYEGSTVSRNIAAEPHSLVMGILYRFLYPRATRVICLCRAMLDDLQKHFVVPRQKMVVIYNPLDSEKIRQKAVQDGNPFEKAGPGDAGEFFAGLQKDQPQMNTNVLAAGIARDYASDCRPFLIAATAGTTNAGVIDPLLKIAKIAEEKKYG